MATTPGSPGPKSTGKQRNTRDIVRLVVSGIGLVLLIAFVIDNSKTVPVGFVVTTTRVSLIWVILIAAVLGAVVDRLVIYLGQRRRRSKG